MSIPRPWLARWPRGRAPGLVQYNIQTAVTIVGRSLVVKDGSDQVAEVSGADPTPILGLSAEGTEETLHTGKVMVVEADGVAVFGSYGDRDPVSGDVGQSYGIAEDASGAWYVDTSDVVNTRVSIVDVDIPRKLYFWRVLAAHRQV